MVSTKKADPQLTSEGECRLSHLSSILSTIFREFPQLVVFLTALLHALPQLIECSVGLCIGWDDPRA